MFKTPVLCLSLKLSNIGLGYLNGSPSWVVGLSLGILPPQVCLKVTLPPRWPSPWGHLLNCAHAAGVCGSTCAPYDGMVFGDRRHGVEGVEWWATWRQCRSAPSIPTLSPRGSSLTLQPILKFFPFFCWFAKNGSQFTLTVNNFLHSSSNLVGYFVTHSLCHTIFLDNFRVG